MFFLQIALPPSFSVEDYYGFKHYFPLKYPR